MAIVGVWVEDRVFVVLDADEEFAEDRSERECDEGNGNCCESGPEHEGVPLPLPYLADECDGVLARGVEELAC